MPAVFVAQPTKPPVVQGNVIALYAQGASKRKIAKDLGIARATVDSILARYSQSEPIQTNRVQRIIPLAYDAVEKAVIGGDARVAMDILKATELSDRRPTFNVAGDMTVQQAVAMLPSTPGSASTTSTPSNTNTTGGATEAAENTPPTSVGLPSHTIFSNFSLAELEQEVARRKAQLIEAEVVGG